MANQPNPVELAYLNAIQGKNEQQRHVISYMFDKPKVAGGCFKAPEFMTDEEYMDIVHRTKDSLNLYQRALDKIGLDEDELQEMPPVCFEGFYFHDNWAKKTRTGDYVSSCYQVSWLFFSSEQVYLYQYIIYLDEDKKKESTEEYFYTDITAFTTRTESETAKNNRGEKWEVESSHVAIVVPGTTLTLSVNDSEDHVFEESIKRMKYKLREKKNR